MRIVYYFNKKLNTSPAKEFLLKYLIQPSDNQKQKDHKVKVLAFIDQTIKFTAENKGHPRPPTSSTVRGYPFLEIRIKDSSNLIRIFYFCLRQKIFVLLNALEKPDFYEKRLKKKIEKEIYKTLNQTRLYYEDYMNNEENYEEYK